MYIETRITIIFLEKNLDDVNSIAFRARVIGKILSFGLGPYHYSSGGNYECAVSGFQNDAREETTTVNSENTVTQLLKEARAETELSDSFCCEKVPKFIDANWFIAFG